MSDQGGPDGPSRTEQRCGNQCSYSKAPFPVSPTRRHRTDVSMITGISQPRFGYLPGSNTVETLWAISALE
jgi:hypothetical protein